MAAKVIAKPIYVFMKNKRQIQEWAILIPSLKAIGMLRAGL